MRPARRIEGYRQPQREVRSVVVVAAARCRTTIPITYDRVLDRELSRPNKAGAPRESLSKRPSKCRSSGMTDSAERACIMVVTGVTERAGMNWSRWPFD